MTVSIKAIVNNGKAKVVKPFPKLMIAKNGTVLLAKAEQHGELDAVVLVVGQASSWKVGSAEDCIDAGNFEDFDGHLTLQNE